MSKQRSESGKPRRFEIKYPSLPPSWHYGNREHADEKRTWMKGFRGAVRKKTQGQDLPWVSRNVRLEVRFEGPERKPDLDNMLKTVVDTLDNRSLPFRGANPKMKRGAILADDHQITRIRARFDCAAREKTTLTLHP